MLTDSELCSLVQAGDRQAGDTLIRRHIGIVQTIIKKVKIPPHIERDDLEQLGMMALFKAARNFDPSRKFKFSTVAWHYVRNDIHGHLQRFQSRWKFFVQFGTNDEGEYGENLLTAREDVDHTDLFAAVDSLDYIERHLIEHHYGLNGKSVSIRELAHRFRMRQTEARELHSRIINRLHDALEC